MNDITQNKSVSEWALEKTVGRILFLVTFAFYAIQIPLFAVPGRWAGMIASFAGLDPFRPLIRPIWSSIHLLLSSWPIAHLSPVIHLLSAALGAGSCWLIYEIVRRIPFVRSFKRKGQDAQERRPRLVAGVFASLFAAVAFPMLTICTRGDYASMDIFLMLLAFYPSMLYRKEPRASFLYLSCLIYGLALIEYPVMSILFPVFITRWVLLLWKSGWPKKSTLALSGIFLISGLPVLLLFAMVYSGGEAASFRNLTEPLAVLKEFLLLYRAELTQSIPRVGWLLIFSMNLVPFAVVMFRELDEPTDVFSAIGVYAFRLVLFGLAIITLFSLPGSPAHILGAKVLLVAPTIFVAIWFGYLSGYYYGVLSQRGKSLLRFMFVSGWVVIILFAGFRHTQQTQVDHLEPIASFSDRVIQNLQGRSYIITDGSLDPSLLLSARKADKQIYLINVNASPSQEQGRYLTAMFDDPENQSLATMGARTLLRGWLNRDPDIAAKAVFLTSPEAARTAGLMPLPSTYFYEMHSTDSAPEARDLFDKLEQTWSDWVVPDMSAMSLGDTGWFQSEFVTRWFSRLANDLGVYLDENSQPDLAAEAYRKAVSLWPDNVSATLNLREQVRLSDSDELDLINEQLKAIAERNPNAFNVQFLNVYCGRVRNPIALLEQASILGRTGQAQLAVEELDKISGLIDEENTGIRLMMGRMYLRGKNSAESEAQFKRVLEADPDNLDGIYGLFEVAMVRRQFSEAGSLLDRMESLGADPKRMQMERAALNFAADNLDDALRQFLEITKDPEAPIDAWFALAHIARQKKDAELMASALTMLERDRNYVPGLLTLGDWAWSEKRNDDAKNYFSRALAIDPANEAALARLMIFDFDERDAASLRVHSGKLLALNPDHAFGNYMSAYTHIDSGRLDLAEAALRRSLNKKDHGPARNELAWVLSELNQNEEALTHALRAVELIPENANAWDTLAGIYQKLGQEDKALTAMEKALELSRNSDVALMLHGLELLKNANQLEKANQLQLELGKKTEQMTPDQVEAWLKLSK